VRVLIGPTSRRASRVYIEGIEAAPGPHPLKGEFLGIALTIAEAYARQLESREVWVWQPSPAIVSGYEDFGYTLQTRRVFFGRRHLFCIKTLESLDGALS